MASRFWSIGPSASQVIFDGGLYRAQLHQYEAIYNADLATYRQTVLTAFQQVEDALAATRVYSQQILAQQEAVKSAQQFLDLEMQRYQSGVDPYVNVVTAQTTLFNDQVTLNTLQVEEMMSTCSTGAGAGRRMGPLAVAHARAGRRKGPPTSDYTMRSKQAMQSRAYVAAN